MVKKCSINNYKLKLKQLCKFSLDNNYIYIYNLCNKFYSIDILYIKLLVIVFKFKNKFISNISNKLYYRFKQINSKLFIEKSKFSINTKLSGIYSF